MVQPRVRVAPSGPLAAASEFWVQASLAGVLSTDSTYGASPLVTVNTSGASKVGGVTIQVPMPDLAPGFKREVVDFEFEWVAAGNAPLGPINTIVWGFYHLPNSAGPSAVELFEYTKSDPGDNIAGTHFDNKDTMSVGSTPLPTELPSNQLMSFKYQVDTNTYTPPLWLFGVRVKVRDSRIS